MLDQPPIFLGGQGGIVGTMPSQFRQCYCRRFHLPQGYYKDRQTDSGKQVRSGSLAFQPGVYSNLKRLVTNNTIYLANVLALRQWYHYIRPLFVGPVFHNHCATGLQRQVDRIIFERTARIDQLIEKANVSLDYFTTQSKGTTLQIKVHQALIANQEALMAFFNKVCQKSFLGEAKQFDLFQREICRQPACDAGYIDTMQALSQETKECGTRWFGSVVQDGCW